MESRACASVAGNGVHSSSAMLTVASSFPWISMEVSGVRRWALPSMCERKVTPSSSSLRRPASDMT